MIMHACIRINVGTRNNLVYVRTSIHVPHPIQDRMNFSRFRRLFSRSASAVLFHATVIHCHCGSYRHQGCLVFHSGMSVTELPGFKVPFSRKDQEMDELNCHEESTQDEGLVAKT